MITLAGVEILQTRRRVRGEGEPIFRAMTRIELPVATTVNTLSRNPMPKPIILVKRKRFLCC